MTTEQQVNEYLKKSGRKFIRAWHWNGNYGIYDTRLGQAFSFEGKARSWGTLLRDLKANDEAHGIVDILRQEAKYEELD